MRTVTTLALVAALALGCGAATTPTRWEYKVLNDWPSNLEETLNTLANDGWELAQFYGSTVVLKRARR